MSPPHARDLNVIPFFPALDFLSRLGRHPFFRAPNAKTAADDVGGAEGGRPDCQNFFKGVCGFEGGAPTTTALPRNGSSASGASAAAAATVAVASGEEGDDDGRPATNNYLVRGGGRALQRDRERRSELLKESTLAVRRIADRDETNHDGLHTPTNPKNPQKK